MQVIEFDKVIKYGTVIFHEIIPAGTNGRTFNKLNQHIQYNGEKYAHEKWYNDKYVEEYLDNSSGENIYRNIYNPKTK
jgi:hypothetical protein